MNPLLSIIIPVYKVEPYIHKCIDSILAQSFTNFELILVDDGSPDNCGAICDEYARNDNRIVVIHQKNGGVSRARNAGLDIAKGKYITFFDSDDEIGTDTTYTQNMEILLHNEKIDILQFPYYMSAGSQQEKLIKVPPKLIESEKNILISWCKDGDMFFVAWNKIYKSTILNKVRFPVDCIFEDIIFLLTIINHSQYLFISDKGSYKYYTREHSLLCSPSTPKKIHDYISAFLQVYLKTIVYKELNNLSIKILLDILKHYVLLIKYETDLLEEVQLEIDRNTPTFFSIIRYSSQKDMLRLLMLKTMGINNYSMAAIWFNKYK